MSQAGEGASPVVYSIGHSDRSLADLLACLVSFGVSAVADVRSWPASRHHPHFDRENLERELAAAGLTYRWLGRELGGLRSSGYEAHMETELYREGLRKLAALAREEATALLCAEREPADCHRRHIAASLARRGFRVEHIVEPGRLLRPGERPGDQGLLF